MCASPLSPRHAQPDWMGGGLVSRQMMHAPASAAIFGSSESPWLWIGAGRQVTSCFDTRETVQPRFVPGPAPTFGPNNPGAVWAPL